MKTVYVTSNYEYVQPMLQKALNDSGVPCTVCAYTMLKGRPVPRLPEGSCLFRSESILRGPLFLKHKMRQTAEFFLKNADLSGADVLHGNMLYRDGLICRILSERSGIPYVVSVRNADLNLPSYWRAFLRPVGLENLRRAGAVICLSRPYRDRLLAFVPPAEREAIAEKCRIIPNGVDDFWLDNRCTKEGGPGETVRFLTVGRIEENKNQLRTAQAIRAWGEKTGRAVRYTLVGDCRDEEMAAALRQFDFVEIKPYMEKESLLGELRGSDVFIMPSHAETFGLVYAEALTQGLPLIYTRGQGFDRQFDDGFVGYPVDSRDAESIRGGIEKLLADYEAIRGRTAEASERFRWSRITAQLTEVYARTAEDARRGSAPE